MFTLRQGSPGIYSGHAGVSPAVIQRTYLASTSAASAARRFAAATLAEWGTDGTVSGDCVQVAAELFANASRFGGCCAPPEFAIRLACCPGFVIIQAGDRYPAPPRRPARRVRWRAESGRGLPITRTLAAQLAWYRDADGWKWIWAAMADGSAAATGGRVASRDRLAVAA